MYAFFKYWILILFVITTIGCTNKKDISTDFNCNTNSYFNNTKAFKDVLKKFTTSIPKSWKTELYYDEFQSKIYSADTTKQLSETYIIDIAWHQGNLNFNTEFETKIANLLSVKEKLKTQKQGYGIFLNHNSYYNLSSGKKGNITYHLLQVYMQYKNDEYYTFTTKIYGDTFVEERICASFSLFKNTIFIP